MFGLLTRVLRALLSALAARGSREAEILVLRQQLQTLSASLGSGFACGT
jgi:hypothetical protein